MATNSDLMMHPHDEGAYTSDILKNVTLDDGTRVVTSPQTDIIGKTAAPAAAKGIPIWR